MDALNKDKCCMQYFHTSKLITYFLRHLFRWNEIWTIIFSSFLNIDYATPNVVIFLFKSYIPVGSVLNIDYATPNVFFLGLNHTSRWGQSFCTFLWWQAYC